MLSADGGSDYLPRLIHHFAEQPDIDLLVSEDAGQVQGVGRSLGRATEVLPEQQQRSEQVLSCQAHVKLAHCMQLLLQPHFIIMAQFSGP
jgi:hypothetical protein